MNKKELSIYLKVEIGTTKCTSYIKTEDLHEVPEELKKLNKRANEEEKNSKSKKNRSNHNKPRTHKPDHHLK